MDIKARSCLLGLLSLSACGLARAHTVPLPPTNVEAAISDPRRPDDQVKLDVNRKPALSVLFSEAKAGDRVPDVMSGNGYFTEDSERRCGSERPCLCIPSNRTDRPLFTQ